MTLHCSEGSLFKLCAVIGDDRVKHRIHGADFRLVVHGDGTARESTGGKELRGGNRALKAVGVDIQLFFTGRAQGVRQQFVLIQPLAEIVPHINFQCAAFGGQITALRIPRRPGFIGDFGQNTGIHNRRAQVVAAHHQNLFQCHISGGGISKSGQGGSQ